jgi:hypothetical protein
MGTRKDRHLQWFTWGVSIVLIIVCNGLLFVGLWASGINLDVALSNSNFYDPQEGYCVRVTWAEVIGFDKPIRVCSEWLDFSDPTGSVHSIRDGEPISYGDDGKLHYQGEDGNRYRLLGLVGFIVLVLFSGLWAKRFLISWYRGRVYETNHP